MESVKSQPPSAGSKNKPRKKTNMKQEASREDGCDMFFCKFG
jgi:hypothetical protein